MGAKETKESKKTKELAIEGVQFESVNSKCLRLYFESQFIGNIEPEDFNYLNHIFELKVKLYFDRHYQKSNLIDIATFTEQKKVAIIDNHKYQKVENVRIESGRKNDEFFTSLFEICKNTLTINGGDPIITDDQLNFNNPPIVIDSNYLKLITQINTLKFIIQYDSCTALVWFILSQIIKDRCTDLKKITIHHYNFDTPDEELFALVGYFLLRNPSIEVVKIKAKTLEEDPKDKEQGDNQSEHSDGEIRDDNDQDEENMFITKMFDQEFKKVQPIKNQQYLFCFFQTLSMKSNLVELEVPLFVKDYCFVLLADVLVHNKGLKKISIRCMNNLSHQNETNEKADLCMLEYTFKTYNDLGEKIKDEIFIFFNYLMTLEDLEVFRLTHFWFNSDLNFMSCELAKENPKLKELSLAYNQAVINNDEALLDSFSFCSTSLVKLDMGISYFHMIRKFDYLIGPNLLELNCGILDFVSAICLMKYVKHTNLRKLKCTLNKPCELDAIDLILQQIGNHIVTSNTLRKFEINNMYNIKYPTDEKEKEELQKLNMQDQPNDRKLEKKFDSIKIIRDAIIKYIMKKLNSNRVLRNLILNRSYTQCLATTIKNFFYIPEKNHNNCYALIKCLNHLLKDKRDMKDRKKELIQTVISFSYGRFRKITI